MGSLLSTPQPDPEWKPEAQFAMEFSCFCVICGSPFDLEGEVYNLDAGATRYKWMRNHRLIASSHAVHYHNLEGLSKEDFHSACYNTSDSTDVFLSARATWNETNDQLFHIDGLYPDTNIPYTITFNAMQQINNHDSIFPLHETCLQISRCAIDHLRPVALGSHEPSSLSILNTMLQSRYRKSSKRTKHDDLIAKNDLFDLCTATDTNGPRSVVGLSLLEWWAGGYEKFYTDPVNVPNITTCVLDLLQNTTAPKACRQSFPPPSRALGALERLPIELLDQISTHFSAHTALSLHRTSRTLAMKVPLDNNFWRKSIMSGNALPYLWDIDTDELDKRRQEHLTASADPDAAWDWEVVGHLLATRHFPLKSLDPRIVDLPNGLWNRRRIWSIVEEAYRRDISKTLTRDRNASALEERKRREPVFDWQVEEIMEDLGHYS
ncbi:hypothetical protein BU25DRAFT_418650 [Macroventuria anomochaeta]|uniref:Uncharacterized protein n=1 Tax=Macroventuria anomochaeta TaxID=301207 RepID=A0ACB6SCM2_9PLEO|nr:uncharacterized protein BU25DRAFT_418650 [Macroventuria anomochaeta]KAF2630999.1 hypothetical protein BU25DRAFT_418650 [Macroventuria anomochaeta]